MMNYDNWGTLLTERFPVRDSKKELAAWDAAKQQLNIGSVVTGIVIAKAPFGAWIDLDVGFPALLEIVCVEGMTPERYQADDWCPLGSQVKAYVGTFNDRNHQIGLSQFQHHVAQP